MKQLYAEMTVDRKPDGWRFMDCPQEFIMMTEYSRKEIREKFSDNILFFFPSEQRGTIDRLFCNAGAENCLFPLHFTLNCKNGHSVQVILQVEALDAGKHLRIGISDITFCAEQAANLQNRLESLEDCIPGGYVQGLVDDGLTIIRYNRNFLSTIGYTQEQFAEELHYKAGYIHPDSLELVIQNIQELVNGQAKSITTEMKIVRRDGTLRDILCTMGLTGEEYNGFPIFQSVGTDVTEYHSNQKLKQKAEGLRIAMEQLSSCVWEYNIAERRILASESLERVFGLSGDVENVPDSLLKRELIAGPSKEDFRRAFEACREGVAKIECTVQARGIHGDFIWLKIRMTTITDEKGIPIKAIAMAEDITGYFNMEMRYQEEEKRRLAMTYNQIFAGKFDLTTNSILEANNEVFPSYGKLKDGSMKELIQKQAAMYISEESRAEYLQFFNLESMQELFKQGTPEIRVEYSSCIQGKPYRWKQAKVYMIQEPKQGHIFAYIYIKDIDEQKNKELELRRHAENDSLTGLYNRFTIEVRCEELLLSCSKDNLAAMMVIDLDDFKIINDTYGHTKGDEVLQEIAENLKKTIGGKNVLLGRLGGDEMVVFSIGCSSMDSIAQMAGQACAALRNTSSLPNAVFGSIGIAVAPYDGDYFASLYKCADNALYHAKHQGKNRYAFYKGRQMEKHRDKNPVDREWLLEESNDLVYVADLYNYNMLYMNRNTQKMFGLQEDSYQGRKCYEILQGFNEPCSFCTNHLLSREAFYTWEFTNEAVGHHFLLRDRIVDWYGLPARIELAADVTAISLLNQTLKDQVKIDQTIISCLRKMNDERWLDNAIMMLLGEIGDFYQAERTFIIGGSAKAGEMELNHEWCREGVKRVVLSDEEWKHFIEVINVCVETHADHLVINLDEWKDKDETLFGIFSRNGIVCQLVAPMFIGGKVAGFIGLDNPSAFQEELTLLETLGYFISEEISRRQLVEELGFLNYHDGLTGLQSRSRFAEYAEQMKYRQVKSLGVVMTDLNALSEYNKYRGDFQGDLLVKKAADLLRSSFPEAQIFRLSGDEFVVLSENLPQDRFVRCVGVMTDSNDELAPYGISIGYAWANKEFELGRLMGQAEEMMLIRKQNYYESNRGLGRTQKSDGMQKFLNAIRQGEVYMYLQPLVHSATGEICSAEALARYVENGKMYMPSQFIPELERAYAIKHLDIFIFEEACRTLARWKEEGKKQIPIAVNFSRLTLLEPELPTQLRKIADKFQVEPRLLELEITETLGDYTNGTIAAVSRELKAEGFRLALDDFGSQYANMSILSAVPVDVLKVDRSMVDELQINRVKRDILRHLFLLCKELGIRSVAEGVETEEQRDMLKSLNCDEFQGYLFGKPMPIEEFERLWINKE